MHVNQIGLPGEKLYIPAAGSSALRSSSALSGSAACRISRIAGPVFSTVKVMGSTLLSPVGGDANATRWPTVDLWKRWLPVSVFVRST